MPRLVDIAKERRDQLTLTSCAWLSEAMNQKGLVKGGIYLLSGAPGAGKTTLALQMAVDLATQGHLVVYVALEQSTHDLKDIIDGRIYRQMREESSTRKSSALPLKEGLNELQRQQQANDDFEEKKARIEANLYIEDSLGSIEALQDFLIRRVTRGELKDTALIIVDSLQGTGLASSSTGVYKKVYEFANNCKALKIPVVLIGHVTKAGAIAGPRTLEHNVDCVLYLRKAMRLRPLFVPKNRFGAERHEPRILTMNSMGCLEPAKHETATARLAYGMLRNMDRPVEVQVAVKLPRFGERAQIKAPYLPTKVVSQIVDIVGGLHDIDLSEMQFDINCAIPGGRTFSRILDFPLAMSMLSSYLQRPIPSGSLFVGELDLFRNIRTLESDDVSALSTLLGDGRVNHIKHLYLEPETALELKAISNGLGKIEIHEVRNLEDVVSKLWPEVVEG